MIQKAGIFLVLMLLVACSSLPKQDQRTWQSVSCNSIKSWDDCMMKASTVCSKGFDIRNQKEDYITQARSMEFSCKFN